MSSSKLTLGVVSDTHNFLDPKVPAILAGVDHIFHAGDIGQPRVLVQLEEIAPVTAVGGNTDDAGFRYRDTELIELGGRKMLLQHIVNPRSLSDALQERLKRDRPDVVVFGHTHKPFYETIDGVLFLNPGSAGKARFGLERTLAVLTCDAQGFQVRFVTLD